MWEGSGARGAHRLLCLLVPYTVLPPLDLWPLALRPGPAVHVYSDYSDQCTLQATADELRAVYALLIPLFRPACTAVRRSAELPDSDHDSDRLAS